MKKKEKGREENDRGKKIDEGREGKVKAFPQSPN